MTTGDAEEITFNVLPQKARDYMEKICADPKLAREFLQRAGIMDENGQLAKPYRSDQED